MDSALPLEYTASGGASASPGFDERSATDTALWLWDRLGWTVVPAHYPCLRNGAVGCSCALGAKCDKPGKHPSGKWGSFLHDDATRALWRHADEHANGSLLTGRRSGVVVGDVDPRHDGRLDTLWERGWSPDTPIARTGGGGWHVYATCPPEGLRSVDDYAPGIELKADGKQVIIPPSLHISHRRYRWLPGRAPWERAVAALPEGVVDAVKASRAARAEPIAPIVLTEEQLRGLAKWVPRLVKQAIDRARAGADGGRHNTGVWLACQLRDLRVSDEVGRSAMLAYQHEVEAQHG